MKNILLLLLLIVTNFGYSQTEQAKTISEKIKVSDQSRFDSIAKSLNYKGGDEIKVSVLFTINEDGDIVDIKARSVHPLFEEEAIRVVSELPKMVPAEYNGKRISQTFALPMVFVIETDKEKEKRLRKEKKQSEKQKN